MKNDTKKHHKTMYLKLKMFTSLSTAINYTYFVDLMNFLVSMETMLTLNLSHFLLFFVPTIHKLEKHLTLIFSC